MSSTAAITPYTSKCHHCHCDKQPNHKSKYSFIEILEKVSAIALALFAAYINPLFFVAFAAVGIGLGIYNKVKSIHDHRHENVASACSQGFLEHLTGVKLPPPISLAANLAITACHIEHHSSVFVPVIGLTIGAWIGHTAAHYGQLQYRKFCNKINSQLQSGDLVKA